MNSTRRRFFGLLSALGLGAAVSKLSTVDRVSAEPALPKRKLKAKWDQPGPLPPFPTKPHVVHVIAVPGTVCSVVEGHDAHPAMPHYLRRSVHGVADVNGECVLRLETELGRVELRVRHPDYLPQHHDLSDVHTKGAVVATFQTKDRNYASP